MKRAVLALLVVACLLLVSQCSRADTVSGNVSCEDGCRIDGARMSLRGAQNYTTRSVQGAYRFDNVTAGEYTLVVESDGFKTWSKPVTVNGSAKVDVLLIEEDPALWPWLVFSAVSLIALVATAYAVSMLLRGRDA